MRNLKILLAIKLRGALHAPGRRGKKASLGRKIELPHLVRTVQKSPLAGNIKFLGGEASRQRRLSRF